MAGGLAGKVTLVTGGASGIGRATALAFAREGAPVVIADMDVAGGEETRHLITTQDGEACFVRADVSPAAEVEVLIGKAALAYGRLDCAFNNAGIYSTFPIVDTTREEWERVIRTNFTGVWLCMAIATIAREQGLMNLLVHARAIVFRMLRLGFLSRRDRTKATLPSRREELRAGDAGGV